MNSPSHEETEIRTENNENKDNRVKQERRKKMAVAVEMHNNTLMSTIDALWALIQNQPKAIRKALVQRIVKSDVEAEAYRQQMMMKQSIDRAFSELAETRRTGRKLPDARNLFK